MIRQWLRHYWNVLKVWSEDEEDRRRMLSEADTEEFIPLPDDEDTKPMARGEFVERCPYCGEYIETGYLSIHKARCKWHRDAWELNKPADDELKF